MLYQAAPDSPPIYPDIRTGEGCEQETGCMLPLFRSGICAENTENSLHVQRTDECGELSDGTYVWIYRPINVRVVQNYYCRPFQVI